MLGKAVNNPVGPEELEEICISIPKALFNKLLTGSETHCRDFAEKFNLVFLVDDGVWTRDSAISLKVQIGTNFVNSIVDTGSSGVVISEACFKRLGLRRKTRR